MNMSDNNDDLNQRPPVLTGEWFPNLTRLERLRMKADIALGRIPAPEGWVDEPEIELPIRPVSGFTVVDE